VRCVGSKKAKDIEFNGVLAYHDKSKGRERGSNTVIRINVDGIRVCHLGDLGHVLDDSQLDDLGEVDILLIPVGGVFTIDAREATKLVEKMNPKIVIPMHYKTDKCDFPLLNVEEFLKGKERVKRVNSSEVEIKELPVSREIIVLEHAL
jgi:L-ascorbate metabolism protein UlaG (beta-lactamase superfamily)